MPRSEKARTFHGLFGPVIAALKDLGGSGTRSEVQAIVADQLNVSEDELSEEHEVAGPKFGHSIGWARFYLAKGGYISSSQRGIWALTDKGWRAELSEEDAAEICQLVNRQLAERRRHSETSGDGEQSLGEQQDTPAAFQSRHRSDLLSLLRSLPPSGFERLCQRLLRESGFQEVYVTGRSGDGGIDGHGILQVNPLVSFQVYFQSKRYSGSVGASVIRDFRGAMQGRADKGLILTTGSFTADARKEAVRDGVPPIELVDADKLIQMFEQLELGLCPVTVYEIDEDFFKEFQTP